MLLSYWENEEAPGISLENSTEIDEFSTPVKGAQLPRLSAVYCLAAHCEGLWLLSGLEVSSMYILLLTLQSGGINLQTVRIDEGRVLHCLKKHTSPVSVLELGNDEKFVLSGSWDRQVHVHIFAVILN